MGTSAPGERAGEQEKERTSETETEGWRKIAGDDLIIRNNLEIKKRRQVEEGRDTCW